MRIAVRVGIIPAHNGPDLVVALSRQQHTAERRTSHWPLNTDLRRELDEVARRYDVHILHGRTVLLPEQHGLAGRLAQQVHDVGQRVTLQHTPLDPVAEYGDTVGRTEFARLTRVLEIAEMLKALEQHGGAGLRQLQRSRDFADRSRALPITEELQDSERPFGRFDRRPPRGTGLPTHVLRFWSRFRGA